MGYTNPFAYLIIYLIYFPYLLLLVSGGHTEFTIIKKFNSYKRIGTTIDDALGEAFDKTARLLKMEYPGGPEIEKYAKGGDENKFKQIENFKFERILIPKFSTKTLIEKGIYKSIYRR